MAAVAPAQQLQAAKKDAKDSGSPEKGLGYGMLPELDRLDFIARCA
jgi:hypothetical protein